MRLTAPIVALGLLASLSVAGTAAAFGGPGKSAEHISERGESMRSQHANARSAVARLAESANGACCVDGGVCLELPADECMVAGGSYQGDGSVCGESGMCSGCCMPDDCMYVLDSPDGMMACLDMGGHPGASMLCPSDSDCQGDINGDGVVDSIDFSLVMDAWGSDANCFADVNGDGFVDVLDTLQVLLNLGPCS